MTDKHDFKARLDSHDLYRAINIYLTHAYGSTEAIPEQIANLLPKNPDFDPKQWIMGEMVERNPAEAPFEEVVTASFRLGNMFYPNMKLRLAKPPREEFFLLSVDSHDAVLQAPEGTPDYKMLEELKAHNAKLAGEIQTQWDKLGLPTERNYMRYKIQTARAKKDSQ